jgi:hypothetical protein
MPYNASLSGTDRADVERQRINDTQAQMLARVPQLIEQNRRLKWFIVALLIVGTLQWLAQWM